MRKQLQEIKRLAYLEHGELRQNPGAGGVGGAVSGPALLMVQGAPCGEGSHHRLHLILSKSVGMTGAHKI